MVKIHPTAVVDPKARLGVDVEIGPYAIVGPGLEIGDGCRIGAHAVLQGLTELGPRNVVHSHAAIGAAPQDKKYRGEPTRLQIGAGNTFREFVTVNTGTVQDQGLTIVGDDNWVMAYVHIAHDCQVGSHTILANAVQLAGHVHVGDWAILGGITGVHQFVKIGAHAMTGAGTTLLQDLPPYVMANGNPAKAHGINTEGLRRRGFEDDAIALLRRAYRRVFKSDDLLAERLTDLDAWCEAEAHANTLKPLRDFLKQSTRGFVR